MTTLNEHSIDFNDEQIEKEYQEAIQAFEEAKIANMSWEQILDYSKQKHFNNQ